MARPTTRAKPAAPAAPGDAPTTPASPAEGEAPASPTPAAESPTIDPRVAELEASLAAVHESYERQIEALRREIAEQRARFDSAWAAREEELASMKVIDRPAPPPAALPEAAPVKGRVLVATCLIRAHTRAGEKVTIIANHPIPDDVDVASLDAGTYAEKGA